MGWQLTPTRDWSSVIIGDTTTTRLHHLIATPPTLVPNAHEGGARIQDVFAWFSGYWKEVETRHPSLFTFWDSFLSFHWELRYMRWRDQQEWSEITCLSDSYWDDGLGWHSHWSLPRRPLGHRLLHRQRLVLHRDAGQAVPSCPRGALYKRSRLIGLFLDGASEGVVQPRPVAAHGRLADVDHDDVAAEVHHLTAGDEGGVVVPRHLTWSMSNVEGEEKEEIVRSLDTREAMKEWEIRGNVFLVFIWGNCIWKKNSANAFGLKWASDLNIPNFPIVV